LKQQSSPNKQKFPVPKLGSPTALVSEIVGGCTGWRSQTLSGVVISCQSLSGVLKITRFLCIKHSVQARIHD